MPVHKIISGGGEYLPFALSRLEHLRTIAKGNGGYASQKYDVGGAVVHVKIERENEFVYIEGGQLYATGYRRQDSVEIFETRVSANAAANFTKSSAVIYTPIGANRYLFVTPAATSFYSVSYDGIVSGQPFSLVGTTRDKTYSVAKGRSGTAIPGYVAAISGTLQPFLAFTGAGSLESIPAGSETPSSSGNNDISTRGSASGYGAGTEPDFLILENLPSVTKDAWNRDVFTPGFLRTTGATGGGGYLPRISSNAFQPMLASAIVVMSPTSWAFVVCLLFSPRPQNDLYSGGDVLVYTTTDNGDTYSINSISAIKTNLPAEPPTRNPALTPEGYLYWPKDYDCTLNAALSNIALFTTSAVVSPTSFVLFTCNYKIVDGVYKNAGEIYLTTDSGATFTSVEFPPLIENKDPVQPVRVENAVYLGGGKLLAKTRSGVFGSDNVWNIIRSVDYGETWVCVPKVGFPESAQFSFHTGHFKVIKAKSGATEATVVLPVWGGDGYYVYLSKDAGSSWEQGARIAPSEEAYRMESDLTDAVPDFNFGRIVFAGPTVPLSVETPWRFDRSRTYIAGE